MHLLIIIIGKIQAIFLCLEFLSFDAYGEYFIDASFRIFLVSIDRILSILCMVQIKMGSFPPFVYYIENIISDMIIIGRNKHNHIRIMFLQCCSICMTTLTGFQSNKLVFTMCVIECGQRCSR